MRVGYSLVVRVIINVGEDAGSIQERSFGYFYIIYRILIYVNTIIFFLYSVAKRILILFFFSHYFYLLSITFHIFMSKYDIFRQKFMILSFQFRKKNSKLFMMNSSFWTSWGKTPRRLSYVSSLIKQSQPARFGTRPGAIV